MQFPQRKATTASNGGCSRLTRSGVAGAGLRAVHSGLAHLRARGLRRLTELVRWAVDDVQTRQHFAASQRTQSPGKLVPALLRYIHAYRESIDSVRVVIPRKGWVPSMCVV